MTDCDLRTIWHEAGHAVAVFVHGGKINYVSACEESGRWAGICTWRRHDDSCVTCDPIDGAVIALAGRVAEESLTSHAAALALERADRLGVGLRDTDRSLARPDVGAAEQALHELRDSASGSGNISDDECVSGYIESIASTTTEAAALALWLRTRTAELVASRRFQALHSRLVGLLLAHGHVDGPTAMSELARTESLFDRAKSEAERLSSPSAWEPLA